mmetsp:Transcript_20204/g.51172  ORF Transcript_20204/g.51172 Transcript_20204/m.51172 type:complete len:206 (-) Transcript_20204:82-699(-)
MRRSAVQGPAARNSDTHPISISWVAGPEDAPCISGRLGLCYCPGKKVLRGGIQHDRDLAKDLRVLRDTHGVTTIVCLLNDAELRSFQLRHYSRGVTSAGFQLISHPIIEMAPPDDAALTDTVIEECAARLQQGQVLAMHCRGGVGRAGLMAACLLLRLGAAATANEAIAMVRGRRCKTAVETRRQEDFVRGYETRLRASLAAPQG